MATNITSGNCTYYSVNNAAGAFHDTGGGQRVWKLYVSGADVYVDQGGAAGVGADVDIPAASGDACGFHVANGSYMYFQTTDQRLLLRCAAGATADVWVTLEA